MKRKTLHDTLLQDWVHHDGKVPYVIEHNYHPDFTKRIGRKKIIIEAKGRFWDYAEFTKYIWIQKALPSTTELVLSVVMESGPLTTALGGLLLTQYLTNGEVKNETNYQEKT